MTTDLAYMVREDWARGAGGARPQSVIILNWLGGGADLLAVQDVRGLDRPDGVDREAAQLLTKASDQRPRPVSMAGLTADTGLAPAGSSVLVLHPDRLEDAEALREVVESGRYARIATILWTRDDEVVPWLDSRQAMNLHTGTREAAVDPIVLEAAKLMKREEYNGLGSGSGKDAVVQLIRELTAAGYLLDHLYRPDSRRWSQAYLAAGGSFTGAREVRKFATEIGQRRQHRVRPRFRENILELLCERVAAPSHDAGE